MTPGSGRYPNQMPRLQARTVRFVDAQSAAKEYIFPAAPPPPGGGTIVLQAMKVYQPKA